MDQQPHEIPATKARPIRTRDLIRSSKKQSTKSRAHQRHVYPDKSNEIQANYVKPKRISVGNRLDENLTESEPKQTGMTSNQSSNRDMKIEASFDPIQGVESSFSDQQTACESDIIPIMEDGMVGTELQPLERKWIVMFDLGTKGCEKSLSSSQQVPLGKFTSIQGFWRLFNNTPYSDRLPRFCNFTMFVDDETSFPTETTLSSLDRVVVFGKNSESYISTLWRASAVAVVGEQLSSLFQVKYLRLCVRPDRVRVNIFIDRVAKSTKEEEITSSLKALLQVDPPPKIRVLFGSVSSQEV